LKVAWYLPIVSRLKLLFANPKDAKNLSCHVTERKCDRLLHHPANSMQWKNIDQEFSKFDLECRNVWFDLVTNVMNPFGNLSTNHSCCCCCYCYRRNH